MEPISKKRKLAPKIDPLSAAAAAAASTKAHDTPYPTQDHPHQERHDFESFARHLQDAAMLIKRQTERSLEQYNDVSVLLLRWEEDQSVEEDLVSLEKALQSYKYNTQRWNIPTVPNPSIKLGVQMASFLEDARPDHLLIIYYAGHGYVGVDGQLFWACNTREDAVKLKWDGVRCLFEDAQSDILLLLDTCAIPDLPVTGSHGMKQIIAASPPLPPSPPPPSEKRDGSPAPEPSFTSLLVSALRKLGKERNFTTQKLHDELCASKQQQAAAQGTVANGGPGAHSQLTMPLLLTLTLGRTQHLTLGPLQNRVVHPSLNGEEPAEPSLVGRLGGSRDDQLIDPESVADLRFEESKILVCTTFVGDASLEMAHFHQWLQDTPENGAKIAVEGMFLGPPTMLLISMSQSIWNIVQHDKVCCFLGYIKSHNMLHIYQKLVGPAGSNHRHLLKAKAADPVLIDGDLQEASGRERAQRESNGHNRKHPEGGAQGSPTANRPSGEAKPEHELEDSVEMQEAAEQLKALSHVRHLSDEASGTGLERHRTTLPNGLPEERALREVEPDGLTNTARGLREAQVLHLKTQRRTVLKQEARCSHCSHAPFKDSSSLKKHVAAAHTRPFPCAFAFAGCQSTFGSKNEWKRHIASQHLCLTFYRCSSCTSAGVPDGKGIEFNRKDLFTQHLRRMHAPFQIKRSETKTDARVQQEWETYVRDMHQKCLIVRRSPPRQAACPHKECQIEFEGPNAWDEWTEHVGRHMEKGGGSKLSMDPILARWAAEEEIIEQVAPGEYRITQNNGGGSQSQGSWGADVSLMGNEAKGTALATTAAPALTDGSSAGSTTRGISVTSGINDMSSSPTQPTSILGKRTTDERDDDPPGGADGEAMSYEEIKKIVDPMVEASNNAHKRPVPTSAAINGGGAEGAREERDFAF